MINLGRSKGDRVHAVPDGETASAGPWHLQLREERLRIHKQQELAGSVRVGTRVVSRVETANMPVCEERLIVEHRPGSGRVTVGDHVLQEGETIDVPVIRERVVVSKQPVIVEEVTVRKEILQQTQRVREVVRREDLAVDGPAELVRTDMRVSGSDQVGRSRSG